MVRPGILAYGFYPSGRVPRTIPVEGVMSFKSRVAQLRDVPAGRFISYGRTYQTKRTTRVGVLPVGYGHGLPWLLSNRGEVLIRGRRAPMIGRVTMDLTMVDVTEIPDVALGDEAVLWGEQGGARITLEEVAERAETHSLRDSVQHGQTGRARLPARRTAGEDPGLDRRRQVGHRRYEDAARAEGPVQNARVPG